MRDPLEGLCVWPVPANTTITVTLFRDARTSDFEDKEWTFVLEDVCMECVLRVKVYVWGVF